MKKTQLYPLQFVPILKEKVWGGEKLTHLLHKNGTNNTGESWELSGVQDNVSKVRSGSLKGKSLDDLIELYKAELVGESVYEKYGHKFPLLFKFIDARHDLSVQLHPNDSIAQQRHQSYGKTEMWYVLQADEKARLILGFNKDLDKESYAKVLESGKITAVLNSERVVADDAFFIPPGIVHAIGAGVLLAEIQQTSDITYRIYDWDRPDIDGSLRELHTEAALDAIDFTTSEAKISYQDTLNKRVLLKDCPYFVTHKLKLDTDFKVENFHNESFKTYMCTEGAAIFETRDCEVSLERGQTLLMPASLNAYVIKAKNTTLLEIYIP